MYNNLHFVNLPTDVMLRRIEVNRKRIADGVFLFAYLELGQRYGLPPIIHGGVDETILNKCGSRKSRRLTGLYLDHKANFDVFLFKPFLTL